MRRNRWPASRGITGRHRRNTHDDIIYELSLRYPKDSLGRKNPQRDPDLRGRADYVCRAGGRVAWTVEAKPEQPGISAEDVEQAYTYARHPEVRGVYFCLCDGKEFRVYATDATPSAGPLRTISVSAGSADESARLLESLLSSRVLLSRFAAVVADTQPSIGPGLHSFAQITGGSIVYDDDIPLSFLRGFTMSIVGGAIQRVDGGLLAYWEAMAPYASIQRTVRDLGLRRVEARSTDTCLSSNPSAPTIFVSEDSTVFPRGRPMLNLLTHTEEPLAATFHAHYRATACGTLHGDRFLGPCELRLRFEVEGGRGDTGGRRRRIHCDRTVRIRVAVKGAVK
jgi:hypothetical protein